MRLKFKLLLPIIFGVVIIGLLIRWYWVPDYIDNEREHFKERNIAILQSLDPSLIKYISSKDFAALYSSMEHVHEIHENYWLSLIVSSAEGQRLYPLRSPDTEHQEGVMTLHHDIKVYGDKIATISIVLDWQREEKVILSAITEIEWLSMAIFAVVMGMGVFWQSAWITMPLLRLKSVAQRMAQGKFDVELPKASNDEIGDLTKTFGIMQQELYQAQERLESALHHAQDRDIRQSAILNAVEDGIITVDHEGVLESFSKGAQVMFRVSEQEMRGKNFSELFVAEKDQGSAKPVFLPANLVDEKLELSARRFDGSVFDVEFTMVKMNIYDEVSYMGVFRDITVYKETAHMKDAFVSTVSHELRTPLTAIKGSLELLQHTDNVGIENNKEKLLEIAKRNVYRLNYLIDDILDISKLESEKLGFTIKANNVADFIREAVEVNQGYAQKFGSKFVITQCPENVSVLADNNRLMQALSNMLSNAVKLSPENTEVKIGATNDEKTVQIAVTDKGPGIPDEFAGELFEKFTQHDTGNTRKVGSTGLGLYITKTIVERMNGSVGFQNEPDGGATFYIILPVAHEMKSVETRQ